MDNQNENNAQSNVQTPVDSSAKKSKALKIIAAVVGGCVVLVILTAVGFVAFGSYIANQNAESAREAQEELDELQRIQEEIQNGR